MKKGVWPLALKKQIALFLHLLSLCLFLTGITYIYFNEQFGRGLSWIWEETYADTEQFTAQLESDVEKIFQYVNYKDLLEYEGELNYDADMVCVTFNSGITKIYTLNDMIRYAKSRGYYLTDTYDVAGGPDVPERDIPGSARPFIEWKTYAPNEVYHEPGEQFATLEDLSLQVLTLLGEYYRVKANYIDQPSNLYFRVSYLEDSGEERLYTNAEGLSLDELKAKGRYLYISSDSIWLDTNLTHIPSNITARLEEYNLNASDEYYVILGLDTKYPNQDPYSEANNAYNHVRTTYLVGLIFFILGGVLFLVTLCWLAWASGFSDAAHTKTALFRFDRTPVEISLLLTALALWAALRLTDFSFGKLSRLFLSDIYRNYGMRLTHMTIIYLICLAEAFSLLRSYKAGAMWPHSLTCRFYTWCKKALTKASFPGRLTACFLAYLAVSGCLAASAYYLYSQRTRLTLPFLPLIPAICFVGFQVFVFLLLYRNNVELEKISQVIFKMTEADTDCKVDAEGFSGKGTELAQALNSIGDNLETAIQEQVKSERLKADLITNVSHDIKTPLTSIINYVDLLKREQIQDEKIQRYLEILDQKSQRLKTLTEDLVEASKASSGNIKLEIAKIDLVELIRQTNGDFEEKFQLRHLELVSSLPGESVLIAADGRRLWRVLENLYNNTFKYAMEHSRVYVDVTQEDGFVYFTIKNISANPLNINAEELTERFVRGDVARTTEGSGLGLSIARSLTQLQGGTLKLYIDGDLFKAQVGFPIVAKDK